MPNNILKRTVAAALSFSIMISAPQTEAAADLVPINGINPPPPCQSVVAPRDAAVGFSMKSFEKKISRACSHKGNTIK